MPEPNFRRAKVYVDVRQSRVPRAPRASTRRFRAPARARPATRPRNSRHPARSRCSSVHLVGDIEAEIETDGVGSGRGHQHVARGDRWRLTGEERCAVRRVVARVDRKGDATRVERGSTHGGASRRDVIGGRKIAIEVVAGLCSHRRAEGSSGMVFGDRSMSPAAAKTNSGAAKERRVKNRIEGSRVSTQRESHILTRCPSAGSRA